MPKKKKFDFAFFLPLSSSPLKCHFPCTLSLQIMLWHELETMNFKIKYPFISGITRKQKPQDQDPFLFHSKMQCVSWKHVLSDDCLPAHMARATGHRALPQQRTLYRKYGLWRIWVRGDSLLQNCRNSKHVIAWWVCPYQSHSRGSPPANCALAVWRWVRQ